MKNIFNILARLSKSPLPLFFVNLDPAPENLKSSNLPHFATPKLKLKNLIIGKTFPSAIVARSTFTPKLIAIAILVESAVAKVKSLNFVKNQRTPLYPVLSVGKQTILIIRNASNTKCYCGQETPNSRNTLKPTTFNTQATHLPSAIKTSPVRASLSRSTEILNKPVQPPDRTPMLTQQKVKNPLFY